MAVAMTKRLTICGLCDGPATALSESLASHLPNWEVRLHDCLSVCAEPLSLAAQADGKATYVFAGIQQTDVDDVLAFVRLYDDSADGWIEDARPMGRLRFCLKSRVPAL